MGVPRGTWAPTGPHGHTARPWVGHMGPAVYCSHRSGAAAQVRPRWHHGSSSYMTEGAVGDVEGAKALRPFR